MSQSNFVPKFAPYAELQALYSDIVLAVMKRHGVEDTDQLPEDRLNQLHVIERTFIHVDGTPDSVMDQDEKAKLVIGAMSYIFDEVDSSFEVPGEEAAITSRMWAYMTSLIYKKENSVLWVKLKEALDKAVTFGDKKEEVVATENNNVEVKVEATETVEVVENKIETATVEKTEEVKEKVDQEVLKKQAEAEKLKKEEEAKQKKAAEEAEKKARIEVQNEAKAFFIRFILANDLVKGFDLSHMKEGVKTNDKSAPKIFNADGTFETVFAKDKDALDRYKAYDKLATKVLPEIESLDTKKVSKQYDYKKYVTFSGGLLNQISTFNKEQLKKAAAVEEKKEENVNNITAKM